MWEDPSPTLVIVADDPGQARLIERNLQRIHFPYTVVVLDNGQAALDYLLPAHYGQEARVWAQRYVVLLDLHVPGCTGAEVLARLKSDTRTQHIPVIILTAEDDEHTIETCYALGCNAYVTKPVVYEQFVEVIQTLGQWLTDIAIPRGSAADRHQGIAREHCSAHLAP
ncbi:MAG: response regulator [Candidatus Tectimicrobiota bacterium]